MGYIEDLYLQGGMICECQSNVTDNCCLFRRLGSVKSVLVPAEILSFSGFLF